MQIETFYLENALFFVPIMVMAAIGYTLLGRFILQFFVADPRSNFIMRFFCLLTDPVYRNFSVITPRFLHPALYPLYYAFFFLFLFRFLWWLVAYNLGFAPTLSGVVEPGPVGPQ